MPNHDKRLSVSHRPFSNVVADMRHVVFGVIRERPLGSGGVGSIALGTGFFVAEDLFITCDHVINHPSDPHQTGDSYILVANLTGSSPRIHRVVGPQVGNGLDLYPELDLAILKVGKTSDQPYAAIMYDEIEPGEEIGITGYPLAQIGRDTNSNLVLDGMIHRCGRGVITARYEASLSQGAPTLPLIETNFMFVSGNSGGPIFNPATGQVVGMVKMVSWAKIADHLCQADLNHKLPAGIQTSYLSAVFAIYSSGVKLDAFRAALESSGISP